MFQEAAFVPEASKMNVNQSNINSEMISHNYFYIDNRND